MDIAIVCYSLTGHTLDTAEELAKGIREAGADARIFNIKNEEADREYLESASGLIIGSPTYLAASVWQIRKWLEEDSLKINLSGSKRSYQT